MYVFICFGLGGTKAATRHEKEKARNAGETNRMSKSKLNFFFCSAFVLIGAY